jgi:regulator of replication initiation timing
MIITEPLGEHPTIQELQAKIEKLEGDVDDHDMRIEDLVKENDALKITIKTIQLTLQNNKIY